MLYLIKDQDLNVKIVAKDNATHVREITTTEDKLWDIINSMSYQTDQGTQIDWPLLVDRLKEEGFEVELCRQFDTNMVFHVPGVT